MEVKFLGQVEQSFKIFYKQATNIVSREILKFRLPPGVHVEIFISALCQFYRKN